MNAVAKTDEAPSVLSSMATRFGMDRRAFEATLRATVMTGNVSNEQAAAFLLVAKQYDLNPFTKEIYAFPSRGGIQPIVSIDGWMKLINSHPQFDGMEFNDTLDDKGALVAVTCRVFRKDRSHPVEVTEYMAECRRQTDTWKQWPARMLRHKATIQAARYAFGFAGIYEPDEAERMADATVVVDVTPDPDRGRLEADMLAIAEEGTERFRAAWKELPKDKRESLASELPRFKALAEAADRCGTEAGE